MLTRRAVVAGLAGLALPLVAEAQKTAKVYRVGVLTPGGHAVGSAPTMATALPSALRELGYVEGQNLAIEHRFADGRLERLPALARELVQLRIDTIFANSPVAVEAAKQATTTVPIVMMLSYSDPVERGFVASFARPGGNITGVVMAAEPTMAGKRLELVKEAIPPATRIAVLTTSEAGSRTQLQWTEKAALSLGIKLSAVELPGADYDRAFAMMVAERADALVVVASVTLATDRARIIQLASKHRLPAIYDWYEHVEEGGLMAYGGSIAAMTRRAAAYLDRVLRGAKPADMPIERATKFQLTINLRTAKALGLTIPPSLLARADQVIE